MRVASWLDSSVIANGNFLNAYIAAPIMELIWTNLGPEFVDDQGKTEIVVRYLYGLKSSGAAFRKNLVKRMSDIGYKHGIDDPDLWLKPEVRDDGVE